jgi:hypothetical protein
MEMSPDLVETGDDGFYKVAYGKIQYLMLDGIKQLYAMVVDNGQKIAGILSRESEKDAKIAELEARLTALEAAVIAGVSGQGAGEGGQGTGGGEQPDTIAPVVTVHGNNPAYVDVGTNYVDLGATMVDAGSPNVGIRTFLDGVEVQSVTIDTSVAVEHTVIYRVTDTAGNVGEATRTVIVGEQQTVGSEQPEPVEEVPIVEEVVSPEEQVPVEVITENPEPTLEEVVNSTS